eukprot:768728-Hanusia_phi.AAC.6
MAQTALGVQGPGPGPGPTHSGRRRAGVGTVSRGLGFADLKMSGITDYAARPPPRRARRAAFADSELGLSIAESEASSYVLCSLEELRGPVAQDSEARIIRRARDPMIGCAPADRGPGISSKSMSNGDVTINLTSLVRIWRRAQQTELPRGREIRGGGTRKDEEGERVEVRKLRGMRREEDVGIDSNSFSSLLQVRRVSFSDGWAG